MNYLSPYLGIIVVLILTGSGLPLPEEVPIIAAGVASATGDLDPWLALASCMVGALMGDCVLYAIGYHFGHRFIREHPWFAWLFRAEQEARLEQQIRQHGLKFFFLARFMVGIRAPFYLATGMLRISFRRFLLVDALCASTVVGFFFGLSYAFGEPIKKWIQKTELGLTLLVVVSVAAVLIFMWRRGLLGKLLRRLRALAGIDKGPAGDASADAAQLTGQAQPPLPSSEGASASADQDRAHGNGAAEPARNGAYGDEAPAHRDR